MLSSPSLSIFLKLAGVKVLSNRRNKGLLRVARDPTGELLVVRTIDFAFFNCGESDGIPSSALREICLLRGVRHPNLMTALFANLQAGMLSVVLPFGEYSMREVFEYTKKIPCDSIHPVMLTEKRWQSMLEQVGLGLSFLHEECEVMHRNLKPENIFLNVIGWTVRIGDFSSSRGFGGIRASFTPEEPKTRKRTPREVSRLIYRAPEIIMRVVSYGPEIDIWSLGVIGFEGLLCLERKEFILAEAGTEAEILFRIFQLFGSPGNQWPHGVFHCRSWWGGSSPGFIHQSSDKLIPKEVVEILTVLHQNSAKLILPLLSLCPTNRPSASAFVSKFVSPNSMPSIVRPIVTKESTLLIYVCESWRGWLFGIAKVLGAPSWVVWAAAQLADSVLPIIEKNAIGHSYVGSRRNSAASNASFVSAESSCDSSYRNSIAAILIASVKLCCRLEESRDFFRLAACSRLAEATKVEGLLEFEEKILRAVRFRVPVPKAPTWAGTGRRSQLALFICDVSFFRGVGVSWALIEALAPLLADVWLGEVLIEARSSKCCFTLLEAQSALRDMIAALTDFKQSYGAHYIEDMHDEFFTIPNIPYPTWPWETLFDALETNACKGCGIDCRAVRAPSARNSEIPSPSTPSRRMLRRSLTDTKRRSSLSSDRRSKRRLSSEVLPSKRPKLE